MKREVFFVAVLALGIAARAQTPVDTSRPLPLRLDLMAMPPAYSYQRLGIFCKLDVQLEKRLRIPVFFRLGDARQVEALEGKGPFALPRIE